MERRSRLPQLDGELFVTDGGIETTLIFHEGLDLPLFAAFGLLDDDAGRAALKRYYAPYIEIAKEHGAGLVLETPTWRASPRWGAELGYSAERLAEINREAVRLLEELRDAAGPMPGPVVLSGCIGPQDDGYSPAARMSAAQAQDYHALQVGAFREAAADLVTAITMTYADEAIGVARAAAAADLPAVISFTVETDGRLPSGQPLGEAIVEVDEATDTGPAYYVVNCAHPTHFEGVLAEGGEWRERIGGVRPNASDKSHAELDEATELDAGDPADLAGHVAALRRHLPRLNVLGGCCGTDHRHIGAMVGTWRAEHDA